mmetsp:Transcript_93746/g.157509  ORF Transcript_93746/g.157509 Transcript_93746/m.157509 type:complete len:102 (+) Transcript_93746:282-587(+)
MGVGVDVGLGVHSGRRKAFRTVAAKGPAACVDVDVGVAVGRECGCECGWGPFPVRAGTSLCQCASTAIFCCQKIAARGTLPQNSAKENARRETQELTEFPF